MKPVDTIEVLVAVLLILTSGFLAGAETALTRMNLVKALTLQDRGRRGAGKLARLMEHPERWLNPLLFLNLLCNMITAALIDVVALHLFGAWGVAASIVIEVVVIFVVA